MIHRKRPSKVIFGWCIDGHHANHSTNPCRATAPGYGVHAGTERKCECDCHR